MNTVAKIEQEGTAVVPRSESAAMRSIIERIMLDPNLPIERVNQAFDFHKRVEDDQAQKEWFSAFVAAQAEMAPVHRDASNPQTRSKYASYEALDRALRPIYTKHGFAPSFDTEASDKPDHVRVVMDLIHKGGHSRRYHADMPADGKGAKGGDAMTKTHATGSAYSYGRRYVLANAFNVATTDKDDDGNAAGDPSGLEPLDDEQIIEMQALITETHSNLERFLQVAKAESVSDILKKDFPRLKALLLKKKGARA